LQYLRVTRWGREENNMYRTPLSLVVGVAAAAILVTSCAPTPSGGSHSAIPPGAVDFGSVKVATAKTESVDIKLKKTAAEEKKPAEAAAKKAPPNPVTVGGTTYSSAQLLKTELDMIDGVPDATDLGARLDSTSLGVGTDFAMAVDCVGADGATVPTCPVPVTFTPTSVGLKLDQVDAEVTLTVGLSAIEASLSNAIQADLGIPAVLVNAVLPFFEPLLLPVFADAFNPLAVVAGHGTT
jgi:hypothetical protein